MASQRQVLRNLLERKIPLPSRTLGRLLVILSRYVKQPIIGEECGREVVEYVEASDDRQGTYYVLLHVYGRFLPMNFNNVIYCFYSRPTTYIFQDTVDYFDRMINYCTDETIRAMLTLDDSRHYRSRYDNIDLGCIYSYMCSKQVRPERIIHLIRMFNFPTEKLIRGMVLLGSRDDCPVLTSYYVAREIVTRLIQTKEISLTPESLMFDMSTTFHELWPDDELMWARRDSHSQEKLLGWNTWIRSLNFTT